MYQIFQSYGNKEIRLVAAHYGTNGAIIDGNGRVFSEEARIDEFTGFRTDYLWPNRHLEWRPMCKKLLLDERVRRLYPHQCFLLAASLVFMLSNACSERGFSLQNHMFHSHGHQHT